MSIFIIYTEDITSFWESFNFVIYEVFGSTGV